MLSPKLVHCTTVKRKMTQTHRTDRLHPDQTSLPADGMRTRNRWIAAGVTGAALIGSALVNRVNTRRAEAATPPVGKFVEVDGVKLHYVDRGQGPAVVLLHGNGVLLQDYEASGVLGLLAADHRVIAFDRPGFGYSERPRTTVWTPAAQADILARALTRIGIERAVVVGHSWGTMVALAMALDHPGTVSGLVLLSGYYYGTVRPDVVPASLPAIPVLGNVMAYTVSPIAGLLIGPPAVALSRCYGELDLPIVVMAGEGDLIAHVDKHAQRFAGDVRGADLRIVPGQGHLFHYAVPEQVAAAVEDVVRRHG